MGKMKSIAGLLGIIATILACQCLINLMKTETQHVVTMNDTPHLANMKNVNL